MNQLSGAASLPGTYFFQKVVSNGSSDWGSFAAWGGTVFKNIPFTNETTVRSSFAAWGCGFPGLADRQIWQNLFMPNTCKNTRFRGTCKKCQKNGLRFFAGLDLRARVKNDRSAQRVFAYKISVIPTHRNLGNVSDMLLRQNISNNSSAAASPRQVRRLSPSTPEGGPRWGSRDGVQFQRLPGRGAEAKPQHLSRQVPRPSLSTPERAPLGEPRQSPCGLQGEAPGPSCIRQAPRSAPGTPPRGPGWWRRGKAAAGPREERRILAPAPLHGIVGENARAGFTRRWFAGGCKFVFVGHVGSHGVAKRKVSKPFFTGHVSQIGFETYRFMGTCRKYPKICVNVQKTCILNVVFSGV